MDLALEFGIPVSQLKRLMTERELRLWARYANEQRLPARRAEYYFAQVALLIAQTMGGSKSNLISDFLINFAPAEADRTIAALQGADVLAAMAGTKVHVLGERRRKREQEQKSRMGDVNDEPKG